MKITIFLILMFTVCKAPTLNSFTIVCTEGIQPYEEIWKAICKVESNNDPLAIGDKHLRQWSYGIAQVRQERLDDYYIETGIRYIIDDMFNPEKAKQVFMYYAHKIKDPDLIIRRWNGSGPMTYIYLNKVRLHIDT